jgi:hypothetical protein
MTAMIVLRPFAAEYVGSVSLLIAVVGSGIAAQG